MSAVGASLSESAFIADLTPREKSFWRVLATVVAGLVSGVIIGLAVGVLALLLFGAAVGLFNGGLAALPQRISAVMAGGATLTGAIALLVLATATNCPLAVTFMGIASLISGRRLLRYITTAPKYRWRLTLLGLGLSCLVLGPVVAVGQLSDPHAQAPPILSLATTLPERLIYAAFCLLLIPAAAAEEVIFRGWLLRQSAAITRNPIFLMVVNGVLFSAVHGEFTPDQNLLHALLGSSAPAAGPVGAVQFGLDWLLAVLVSDTFLTRAMMGAGFVYMTLRLRGIEFSTGAHAANNLMIVLFVQPLTLTSSATAGTSAPALIQDVFLFASYVVMAELTARWTPLRRWSGADLGAEAAVVETFA